MGENKIAKYLLYAIGEIILVVIGILIAVQIDNSNNDSKERAKEKILLSEINEEFKTNRVLFDSVKFSLMKAARSMEWIIDKTPIANASLLPYDSLYSNLKTVISYSNTFEPSQSTIKSIVNTSSYEIIMNDTLRKLLIQWPDVLLDFQNAEKDLQDYRKANMIPYFMDKFELKKFYVDEELDPEFTETTLFANQMWTLYYRFGQLTEESSFLKVDNMIDEIIELTEK